MSDNFLSKIGTKLDTTESKLSDLLADSGVAPVPVLPPLVEPEAPLADDVEPVIEQPAAQDEDVEPFEPLVRQADMSEDGQPVAQTGLPQFESMGQLEQHQLELRKPAASTSDQIKMAIAGTAAPLLGGVGHITSGVVNFLLEDYTEADSSDSTAAAFAKWTGRAVQELANLPNMGGEALGEYGHLLGPSANARANAMETERQLALADAGFQTMGEAYVKGILNSTSIDTIQEGLIAFAPSILAVKAMGVRIPMALATLEGGSQGAKDLVSNKSLEFITEALSSGQLYQQDVEILQQILPLIDDEKGIGAVLALTAGMLKDAGSDLEFNMPPESEMTSARVIGGAGAAIDWGVMGQLAKLNFAGMPFSQAVRQGVGPSLLPRTAASLALGTGNEAIIDALAQAAGKEGNLGERLAQVDPAQNIAAATAGYGGGIGITAAGTPFSPTSREAIGKAASKAASTAARATAPVRKKLSDVFSPTDSTRVAIEASQKLSPEAFNRESMTVKGEAVSESYNPFIEARRVLDQATQFAEGVDDPAEATELAQEAFTAAADHIDNMQAIAEGISNDKTLKPKEREAILEEVTKTVGDYIYVVQELGKKATDTLLDNDLALTPKQQQAAKDVVLGSLNAGNQTLEQLQALADTETFRNDPRALEQIQSVMAIAEAGQSLRAKDVDGVSSEYFLGNPDKAGHYGIPEYLQRAEAAKLTGDLKELNALVGRMERWMKSGEKTKVWNPEVIERRKAEREYLALATEQVKAMRDGLVEGEVVVPPRESAQPTDAAQDVTAQQGPKPEAIQGPAKSSTRPVADREISFKDAQERAKAAMDSMADDVSGADRWEAFVRSLEQSLESYGDKSAHGAQSIQRGIDRGRAYIAKLRKEEGKPAEQAPTSSDKSSTAPAEQEAAQTPEPKMADAVKVAREAMDASESEDAAQAYISSLEAQLESFPEGAERTRLEQHIQKAKDRRDAPKADALLPTGSVATIVKVKDENATSGLLNGKGLADIVSGMKAVGNRAKGIFMYAVDVASKVVSTNSGIMKSRKVFTDAAMERVKADFPKASPEELATYRTAVEKLFNTLYRDRNVGLLDREQTKGVTTAFADFQNPLAMLMVLNPETNQLQLPATVRASIQISALNWVDSLGRQNAVRTLDSVKDFFGLGEYDTIPMHLFNKYVAIGTRREVAARNIGADILRSLGLSFDGSKVPAGFRDNMESALGAAAIGYLTEKGLVRPPNESSIPAKEWRQDWFEATGETISAENLQSITFVQIPILDGQLTEAVETAVAPFRDFPALSNTLLSNETHRAVPATEASEYVPSSTRKGSTIAENLRDILRSYQATPNRTNQNLKSILAQDNAQEILETLMGLDTFDPNTVHVLRRRAAISANDNAKREISDMLDAYKANPKLVDSDMFFESEFSFQLRNMMTTSGINPQRYASHRHFVSPAAANITINNEVASNPESVGLILDGIIMELGADESTRDSGRVSAKGQLNSIEIPEALAKKMDNFLSGNVVTADSIQSIISEFFVLPEMVGALSSIGEKAPSGLTALNTALNIYQLQQVRKGKLAEFVGQFETENDGKTNGFFLLLAQMPVLGDMVTWFERTGLYLEGVSSAASFNEYINKDGTLDSYQTLGSDVYNSGLDPVLADFLTFFEGELVTEDGNVSSTLRNLMKNPFMIFNYGSSLGRIKKDARLMMESAVISKAEAIHAAAKAAAALPEGKERTDALNAAKRELNTFNEFLGTNFSARGLLEQGQALKVAINTHIHNSKYGSGKDALSTIGSMFGDAIAASIEDSLGALAPVRDMVNETFYHQWSVFDTAFTAAMDRLEAQGEVTQKDADDMMKALEPLLPHYHGYTDSKGVHSPTRIPIFSVETEVTENSRVQVSFRSPAVLGGTKSLTVQAMRRAIKDGGVSGFSIATHSQDAMIMLKLYEAGHQLQGRHDAQAVGALDRVKAAQAANKATVDVMSNYSMLHDFMQSAQESLDYAISRGAEVSSEALLLFTESLKALKPEIEAIQAERMEMLNGKSVSVDQYPTMGGEGAYSTTLNLKPVQITGFQKVTDAAATALRDVIHNPPAGLLTFLNNRVDDKFRKLARELYTYNKDHGDGKLADTPAGALLDTVRNISTVAGFREAMQVNNQGLYEGVVDLLNELEDVASKTRLEGKPFQTREESRSRSGLLSAINKSLGLSQTQASESGTPKHEFRMPAEMDNVLQDPQHEWLSSSFIRFINYHKDKVTDDRLLDKSLSNTERVKAFIEHMISVRNSTETVQEFEADPLIQAYIKSKARRDAIEAVWLAVSVRVQDTQPAVVAEADTSSSEAVVEYEVASAPKEVDWHGAVVYTQFDGMKPGEFKRFRMAPDDPYGIGFNYISEDGKKIAGDYMASSTGLYHFNIASEDGPSSMKGKEIRKIARAILEAHPNATQLQGFRISGMRAKSEGDASVLFSIKNGRLVLDRTDAVVESAEGSESLAEADNTTKDAPLEDSDNLRPWEKLFSFADPKTAPIDPVKLAEDAEVQHVTADSIKSIFEALLSDDTVSVTPSIRKLYEGLINNLIGPALESVGEIGLQLRKNVEDIGGNFGALTSAGISIVSGMPRTLNAQSTTEVFLHELAHRFSFEALLQDTEARAQLSDLFEQARKALDYKIFLVKDAEGNTVHLTDRDAEVEHAKRMFDYMFNNPDRITTEDGTVIATGLVEFVAYVLTNPAMMEATKDLRVHDAPSGIPKFVDGMDTDSLLSRVFNWVYRAFANVLDWLADSPKGRDVHQRVFNLVMDLNGLQQKQVKKHQRYLSRTSSGVGKGIDAVNSTVKNYIESVKNALTHNVAPLPEVEAVRSALRIKLVEVGASMHGVNKQQIDQLIEVIMNSDNPIRDLNALESKYSILQDEGFVKSIMDTMTGKLSRSAPQLQRELNRAITEVDRNRETTRVATKQNVVSGFIKKLTNTEKEAITAPLISADIVTLVDRFGFRKVGALLRDNQTLHNEAARLEKAIKENSPKYFNGIIQQAKGMADVIITGSGARESQVSNIASIINGSPWPSLVDFQSSHKNAQQLQADLDAYVSLRALIAVDRSTRALTSKVWDREFEANSKHNGITNVITLHRGMKADALKQIFDNNPNHMVKGWTPQMFDADMEWQQANPERGAELERLGWKKVYDINTKIEGGQLALYARKTNGGSELVKGAFGYEGRRARGTNIAEAYSEALGSYDGIEIGALKERAKEVYSRLALRQMNPNYRLTDRKNPIAIQNVEGEVVTYSHIMSESTKREVLGKRSLIDEVMGDYAARTVGKRSSEAVNRDVINALNEDYVANFENNPNDFMWVTAEEWSSDGTRNKFANQFKMLPYDARQAAREHWGNKGIPIRKGFGRVVFGGHKYSLANSDLITQLSERFPNTPLGGIREIVVNIEKVWQEITRIAKVGMVIKTPVVVLINIVSNLMVLAVHRINPVTAMRDAVVGIRELRKYEELSKRLSVLQLQLRGATTQAEARSLGVHVTRLRSQLDASPIRPMVKEGMFQSIIEDVDTSRFGYTDKIAEYLTTKSENFIGKTATDVATWLPNQLMMGSNTAVFKFLNKVTQYSDFVARYSFVKQMSKKNPTMPKQQLYNEAIDNFINYNIPDHVGLQWMNDMGIVMFTKYWLGIQHVIARMFKDRPVEALTSAIGQMTMYDISDIYDDSLLNKGVTRAFRAPTDVLDSATKMYGLEFWKWASPF